MQKEVLYGAGGNIYFGFSHMSDVVEIALLTTYSCLCSPEYLLLLFFDDGFVTFVHLDIYIYIYICPKKTGLAIFKL